MDGESCKTAQKASSSSSKLLSPDDARNLLDSVDLFLIDCDGVIYKKYALIDGVIPTLEMLRSKGKKLVFVTNNSKRSRKHHVKKFHALGVAVSEDEIFSASFAVAMYLKLSGFPQDKKVYVIGAEEGIIEELKLAGFTVISSLEVGKMTEQLAPNCPIEHDRSVGAVVVEQDPYITHSKLKYGTLCIRENPGCLFIATNRDAVGYMTDLKEWPGDGCMVAAITESTQKQPIVVGKPSSLMMDLILQKYPITTSKMCMVGDRLDTDILFGQNAGCKTLLVFSGVATKSSLEDPSNHIQPDYYTGKVSDILGLL